MKVFKFGILLFFILSIILIIGCGFVGQIQGKSLTTKKPYAPEWWEKQENPDFVSTYGMAIKENENTSRDAAYADAMLRADEFVGETAMLMMKQFEQEAQVDTVKNLNLTNKIVKAVAGIKYTKVQITKQETIITDNNRYKTFVQVSIPKNTVDKELVNNIRSEEALFKQLKTSEAFQGLVKQISQDKE
jgi:hypothetical protein